MISLRRVLMFFLLVGTFLLPVVIFFPSTGIKVGPFNLKMMNWQALIGRDTTHYADITNIVNAAQNIDSLPDVLDQMSLDSANLREFQSFKLDSNAKFYRIDYNAAGKANLLSFFEKLKAGIANEKQIRILHYGDSQLEGDRITSYIRQKLQNRFGGNGVGLLPALQPYESFFSVVQSNTGTWQRHTTFGRKDPKVPHNRYGVLAAFSRFAPIRRDSVFSDTVLYRASVNFSESKTAYSGVRKFRKINILYGNSRKPVAITIKSHGVVLKTDSLKKGTDFDMFSFVFAEYVNQLTVEFSGYDSPDIYAIDLSDLNGIAVDNISMRGSSGTFFNMMNYNHLASMYKQLNVELIILQFGGNVMPYIKDSAAAKTYGRWIGAQLNTLKKMLPGATVVVVGPSDMSRKDGENYITYGFLPVVRDELRKATLNAGYSFWDMYEAMGGYNSMPEWVRANPPLAGTDYTHFTYLGAKVIANLFYNSLVIEFAENQNTVTNPKITKKP